MKKLILLLALMTAVSGYSKSIPSPSVLFALSEKILNEAHNLVFPMENEHKTKFKIDVRGKSKPAEKTPLLKETKVWNPSFTLKRDGMWIVAV
ncbi:MAG TPA: hypothetical protein VFQ50_09530 [Flavobacterium sp.]|jgi:hypothetical protein|nr:hypothetical protein [Flavobacterium sp.]